MAKNTNCGEWIINITTKDWSNDVDLAFKKLNSLFGVEYKPAVQLATQIVAGTNYAFLAKQTIIQNPNIQKNLQQNGQKK